MRSVLLSGLTLVLSLYSTVLPAYEGEEYPQEEQYPSESYPEEGYPQSMPEEGMPEQGMQEQIPPDGSIPPEQDYAPPVEPENSDHLLEIRRMCEESAMGAGLQDEEINQFIEDCIHGQGY